MAQKIQWDTAGTRTYETGVDHGVLYPMDTNGLYPKGYAWNGITAISESPSGAEANPLYADNIKYLNLISAEDFAVTIEAYTYPAEFALCDGSVAPTPGVIINQQTRKSFGLVYRTVLGNDVSGNDLGYKLHLVYGGTASPSEKAYSTINESPEAITFSWEVKTVAPGVIGYKPTASIVIDSTLCNSALLAALEVILFGVAAVGAVPGPAVPAVEGRLPLPDEVITLMTPVVGG